MTKKTLKKIKYWQRNGGFKFWAEVKITRLTDVFTAVFSDQFFSLEAEISCKKLKLVGNLSDCPRILTVGRLTHKQRTKPCLRFFSFETFFQ